LGFLEADAAEMKFRVQNIYYESTPITYARKVGLGRGKSGKSYNQD
jgi:hypothetical protein